MAALTSNILIRRHKNGQPNFSNHKERGVQTFDIQSVLFVLWAARISSGVAIEFHNMGSREYEHQLKFCRFYRQAANYAAVSQNA